MPRSPLHHQLSPRQRAVHRVRQWITEGRLADGDALPSERNLAEHLALARGTVRSALDELAREGLIAPAAGGQRRVQRAGRHGLLASTVALLTEAPAIPAPERVPMGQDLFIQLDLVRRLTGSGRHVLTVDPARLDAAGAEQLIASRPRGVIVTNAVAAAAESRNLLHRLVTGGVPVVAHDFSRGLRAFDHVTSDQEQGGYDLTRWLIAQGRRRILCFWRFSTARDWIDDRYAGHLRAMREARLKPLPALVTPELAMFSESPDGFAVASRHLSGFLHESLSAQANAIDAVMTATDSHAYQTAAACRLLGRTPGGDVLITGYDHLGATCAERAFEPSGLAATVDKDNPAIAAAMIALLDARIANTLPDEPQRVVVPHRLISSI